MFASIQIGSGIAAEGYRVMPFGTGYEEVLAGRVGKKFAYVATGKGKVLSIKNDVMRIQYDTGEIVAIEVGLVMTHGEGHTYPNTIVTTVKVGDTFDVGDGLSYNTSWFEASPHDPRLLSYKQGVPGWVMLSENVNTLEDGSTLSPEMAKKLTASHVETRELVFGFKDTLHNLVNIGTHLTPDDILCTIENASTAAANLFDAETLESLGQLTDNSPRAKFHGEVVAIDVRYNGDIEDMSPSMAKLVEEFDKRVRLKAKDLGKNIDGGRTDESLRIDGQSLQVDQIAIMIHISHAEPSGDGNKAVWGNQLKTVHGPVANEPMVTESGRVIDINYSDKGVEGRVVRSARRVGMLNMCLLKSGERFVSAYRGK